MNRNVKGFSLIELMITVAIIGILALAAQPIYSSYMIKIRHTQLMTHALEISKRIEIELNSGSDSLLNSVAGMFCEPGSLHAGTGAIMRCTQNHNFHPPQGTTPSGGTPKSFAMLQANSYFNLTGQIDYPDSSIYSFSYTIKDDATTIQIALISPKGGMMENLYSTQDHLLFARVLIMYKGANMTLYDKELNKKQPHLGWYCGFDTVYSSITPLPLTSEMPITCKHMTTGAMVGQDPEFQEV